MWTDDQETDSLTTTSTFLNTQNKIVSIKCTNVVVISLLYNFPGACALRSVSHLFLVGGFAESPLVQEEVRSMFTTNTLKVLIPQVLYLLLIVIKPTTYMCNRTSLQTVTQINRTYSMLCCLNYPYVVLTSELSLFFKHGTFD